jgi:hypothetical protein
VPCPARAGSVDPAATRFAPPVCSTALRALVQGVGVGVGATDEDDAFAGERVLESYSCAVLLGGLPMHGVSMTTMMVCHWHRHL